MSGKIDDDICDGLMLRVAQGDGGALERLFRGEAGRLIAIARRIVCRRDLAEEVVQDSFVAAWRNAGSYDPVRGRARAWLTRIVRNKALNVVRDDARIDYVDAGQLSERQDRLGDAERVHASLGESDALRQCLDGLDHPKRQSILLAYVVGYSHGEIAAELKAPLGTVKAWIRRGVIALQECLS